jgi:Ca2+-binding EF-hand superfamily protein
VLALGSIAWAAKDRVPGATRYERLRALDGNRDGAVSAEEYERAHRQRFAQHDANKDGVLDANEILSPRPARGGRGDPAERLLKRFDANADGRLTKEEHEAGQRAAFAKRDKNGDGRISADEAPRGFRGRARVSQETTLEASLQRSAQRFARYDANRDGAIEAGELAKELAERREYFARRAMHRYDVNRDGKVTPEEHIAPVRQRFLGLDLDDSGRISADDLPPDVRASWNAP